MGEKIEYLKSFGPETKFVPLVIEDLSKDLRHSSFLEHDIMEIIMAVDEALTNAILETAKSTQSITDSTKQELSDNSVSVRWSIDEDKFAFTVIDQGRGLDLDIMLGRVPVPKNKDYFETVQEYEKKDQLLIRINGQPVEVKRFGAGLKIILSFMDLITIDYIDKEEIISKKISGATQGTIFNMIRFRNRSF